MFYQGHLQSGIAQALQESKLVICFVRDQSPESSTWETEYFPDEELAPIIQSRAICLLIDAGSQEAAFLTSFCPIPKTPTVVVIKNGTLVAYLSSGVSKSDFLARLRLSLEDADTSSRPLPQSDPSTSATSHHDNQDPPAAREPEPETSVAEESTDSNVAATPPVSKATGKRPEKAKEHESEDTSSSEVSSRQDYVKQQRMREQAAKAERARILQRIRSDREEWKHKEQVQQGASAAPGKESTPRSESQRTTSLNQPRSTQQFRIQVRLFDGSTIRSTFSSDQTIGTDVRQWVDQQIASANVPYTLKQVLAPLPNRTISMSDEEESLRSLALGPSATLVMVPIQSYTNAYTGSEPGLVHRGISGGYGLVRSAVGSIYDGLSTFLGLGQTPSTSGSETQGNNSAGAPGSGFNDGAGSTSSGEGIKIRTLADQRRERGDQQFYNGNQLNFEPRRDDDDDDKKD